MKYRHLFHTYKFWVYFSFNSLHFTPIDKLSQRVVYHLLVFVKKKEGILDIMVTQQ